MTQYELARSLRDLNYRLECLAAQAEDITPEPTERALQSSDILYGTGKLATVGYAPGYRDARLHVTMEHGQRLEVCLSIQDSLWLHAELANMLKLAGDRPLDEGIQ